MVSRIHSNLPVLALFTGALMIAGVATPARAAERTYDLTMKTVAQNLEGKKFKVTVTGAMTWDDATGAVTFNVDEDTGVNIQGSGLLGNGKITIGKTSLEAFAGSMEPVFTGTGFFVGKFSKDKSKFKGKFTAVADSFGPAPGGYTFNTGTVKAKLHSTPMGQR